jgi:diacylglycerol kinase (ATP)
MKLLFAINPVSGGKDKTAEIDQIKTFCQHTNAEVEVLMLTGEDDLALLRDRIAQTRPDRLVAMGGDGTIKLVAEAGMATNLPVAILPAGSANGMARELGLPDSFADALQLTTGGHEKAIDLLRVNGEICLHLSDIGLNAQLVRYYQKNKLRGMLGYARGVWQVLLRKRILTVNIQTHDSLLRREAYMVVLANARTYGTGAVINPDGRLDDGQFEVVIMRRLSFLEVLKMFWRFQAYDPGKTEVIPAQHVQIDTRRRVHFQVDGEYQGRVNRIEAEILPAAVRVIINKQLIVNN